MKSQISIILPTYNGGRYIRRAIESIISQSFLDWELLIIDDGSIDDTEKIIKEYQDKDKRIIYIKNEFNLGIQKSLNKGLKKAKGEYIARIDDDDEWIDKDKLKKQIEFLKHNKEYILVGTGAIVLNEKREELFRYLLFETDKEIRNKFLSKNCFIHSSVLFRKDIVLNIGGYSEDIKVKHLEDYDLWLKMGIFGKFANLLIYGVNFMQRESSISSTNKLEQFKKDLILIKEFKNKYPNYYKSIFYGYIRIFLFKIFKITPVSFKNRIIKLYKEF